MHPQPLTHASLQGPSATSPAAGQLGGQAETQSEYSWPPGTGALRAQEGAVRPQGLLSSRQTSPTLESRWPQRLAERALRGWLSAQETKVPGGLLVSSQSGRAGSLGAEHRDRQQPYRRSQASSSRWVCCLAQYWA